MKEMKDKKDGRLPSECTTIIVGDRMTADGSRIFARSGDFNALKAAVFERFEDTEDGPREFVAVDSPFRCPLPAKALGYSAIPDFGYPGEWGAAGYNSEGIGMSATETIFSSDAVLAIDPYVEEGLAENSVYNVVIPYIHSAREGVERLGKLIEEHGSAEGFGVGFMDSKEVWYLENAGGHRFLACRIPEDRYFVTGNQSRFREYDPEDKENFIASSDLVEFAVKNGFHDPANGKFDFHEAYSRDVRLDTTYNYPRVWGLQKMFTPSVKTNVKVNDFPVYAKADKPISIADLRKAYRFHYDRTSHDPYLHSNGREPYRPVSIFRTTQTHILQVRPWLPKEIGCVNYVAFGMADLGVFLPLYQGVGSYPEAYLHGELGSDSAYWRFRKVMTLGMTDYNALAPVIKRAYGRLEKEIDRKQAAMEKKYLELLPVDKDKAAKLLQKFSDDMFKKALDVADSLADKLLFQMSASIQEEYLFHGA